jgi:hypothetical protein
MVRIRKVVDNNWPSWRYSPDGEGAIFQCAADVPMGWTKKPGEPYEAPPPTPKYSREELITALQELGIVAKGDWSVAYMKELIDGSSTPR